MGAAEQEHNVIVNDGAEYTGETYIRCYPCGVTFDEGHLGLPALLKFLREHGALND